MVLPYPIFHFLPEVLCLLDQLIRFRVGGNTGYVVIQGVALPSARVEVINPAAVRGIKDMPQGLKDIPVVPSPAGAWPVA